MPRFSEEAAAALENYGWPGNVRELKNLVERAVYRSDSPVISLIDFDPFRSTRDPQQTPAVNEIRWEGRRAPDDDLIDSPLGEAVRELHIRFLKKAIEEARYNQRKAARILGLTYHQFRGLYRKYHQEIT
ncbi:MAG: helix-turn-helix domain-containing protein [Pseudomonadota bacterium]